MSFVIPKVTALHRAVVAPPEGHRALVGVSLLTGEPTSMIAALRDGFGAEGAAIWVRDGASLRLFASIGVADPAPLLLVGCEAAANGAPMPLEGGAHCVALSLDQGQDVVGLCAVVTRRVLDDQEIEDLHALCVRLGAEAAWRASHHRLLAEHERLREAALVDELTGTWTRAAFERTVMVELAAARRRGETLTLVVFDIVGLDRFNAAHGHRAGDAVLAHTAAVLRANVRVSDEMARVGGDEIAVLLLGSDLSASEKVVAKLVGKIAASPARVDGLELRIQVRAGVTGFATVERTVDNALNRARWAIGGVAPEGVAVVAADAAVERADAAETDGLAGSTLAGMYRIVHEISRGATGVVYRGEDLALGRPVAIKVLRSDLAHDPELVARFRVEAATLASLRHPNLVEVYAGGLFGDDVYFVMELVEGRDVTDLIEQAAARGEWVELHGAAAIVQEVADALDAMHRVGLIHRDVKPDNVVLDRVNTRAVLVDCGTAMRSGEQLTGAGTPGYAAPESFAGEAETTATDVYGLGAMAYTIITGRLVYGAGDALSILARQLDGPPEPASHHRPGISAAVDEVLLKALSVDPSARFASPGAFAVALVAAIKRSEGAATSGTPLDATLRAPSALPATPSMVIEIEDDETEAPPDALGAVRGAAFRVANKVLSLRLGEWCLRKIAEEDQELGTLLRPTLAAMSWQPARALVSLLQRPEITADPFDLARTIGLGLVATTFGQILGADPASQTPESALAAAPSYWSRYFTAAEVQVVTAVADHASLRVVGAVADPIVRNLMIGCVQRVAELTGVDAVEVQTYPLPDGAWRFDVAWKLEEFVLDDLLDEPPSRRTGKHTALRLTGLRNVPRTT